ncbi:hypothetical protein PNP85_14100 [Halobacterium salinarum]|uniref:hypothetical protein n=1 Tax=Halobacterium salinarum TaxID=2242 RepID=UPI00255767B6|nr:hypothetical protein [Halobacterium salinarum]MDL0137060.1 hypothetical protein [Halobacterium salinarum]MDL0140636.1 hypothetical protein [Halobacterium salinarum]
MENTATTQQHQLDNGSFRGGDNGVYDVEETPVRTTARWLIANVYCYQQSELERFYQTSKLAADYLLTTEARPAQFTFQARTSGSDLCDGLVGQAEPIKSLARAGRILECELYTNTAIDVFSLHPFDEELGLWEAVEIDGEKLSFDRTLNHQLIFAGAAAELVEHSKLAEDRVIQFLDRLGNNMQTRSEGLVRHYIRPPMSRVPPAVAQHPRHWPLIWNETIARYHARSDERRRKELGYHPTVLAALSTLKRKFPEHDVWEHDQIQAALSFTKTETYRDQVENRTSEYGSMLPGINHARILNAFEDASPEELRPWVQSDIDRTYDPETGLLTRNAIDPVFQASSISAATGLPDMEIQIPDEPNSKSY